MTWKDALSLNSSAVADALRFPARDERSPGRSCPGNLSRKSMIVSSAAQASPMLWTYGLRALLQAVTDYCHCEE